MLNLKSIFNRVGISVIFVLIIFTPSLRFLPYYTWLLALFGLSSLFDSSFRKLIRFNGRYNKLFIISLFLCFFYNIVAVPILHGCRDCSYVPLQIGIVLTLLRDVLLVYIIHKFCHTTDLLKGYCNYFLIACCVYVLFTLVFIYAPSFKDFWLGSILANAEDRTKTFMAYEFRYSLDGFAAFSSSSTFSFACLLCCYRISQNNKVSLLQILCLMTIVVGCFFYGRISLIGMLLGSFLIIRNNTHPLKSIKVFLYILAVTFFLLSVLEGLSRTNDSIAIWEEWAFALIRQLFIEKEVTDYSATHMFEDMYYMPEIGTLIIGDGQYTAANGAYYGSTDVGFMRLILYGGLLGLIVSYNTVIRLAKSIIASVYSDDRLFKIFIVLSVILFGVLEMKGESYHRALMLLYPLFLISNYQHSQKKSIDYE